MNRVTLITCLFIIISCRHKTQPQPFKLSGQYAVGGFKVKNDIEKNGRTLIAASGNKPFDFNFITGDAVQIAGKLSVAYFSDSIFQYKLTDQTLYLKGQNGEQVIPYTRSGDILNLYINRNGIDTLQIVPTKR